MPESPSRSPFPLFVLGALAALSGILFSAAPESLLCLLPLGLFAAWRFLPLLGEKADQHFLIAFLILCFFIDDFTQVPWGRMVDTFTEDLGILLFKSFGITGLEAFTFLFAAWLVLVRPKAQFKRWIELGLIPLLLVSCGIFLASAVGGFVGIRSGGNPVTYFIQTRFLHVFPIWAFIGFVVMRDVAIVKRVIFWTTVMVTLKSLQAVFVYWGNRATYQDAEYLVDHYYSMFAVVALIGLAYYLWVQKSWMIRLACVVGLAAVASAYFINDRRTSLVGVVFGFGMLPAFLPFSWLKRYLPKLFAAGLAFVLFTAVTWNVDGPLGFVGNTLRSFGSEPGESSGPSYRDLENANLLHAVSQRPFTGIGYGKEFDEIYPLPDISQIYDRYRMIPHNLFLASWAYGGPLTIAATSLLFAFMIGLAGQLIGRGPTGPVFVLGVMALFYALQYLSFTFGDIGLQILRNQMLGGLLMGACFRLLKEAQTKEALCKRI